MAFQGPHTTAWDFCLQLIFWVVHVLSTLLCCVWNVYLSLRLCKTQASSCHLFIKGSEGDHTSKVSLAFCIQHFQWIKSREWATAGQKIDRKKESGIACEEGMGVRPSNSIPCDPGRASFVFFLQSSCSHLSPIFCGAATLILHMKTKSPELHYL